MKKNNWIFSGFANCQDCDWKSSSYKNILGISAIHAKRYKHRVLVDIAHGFEYDGTVD